MYKPRTLLQLDVPRFGSRTEFVVLHPRIIEAKWTKNNHLVADELTVTIGWKEGGVEPRAIKNARCGFWLWDSNREDFDEVKHLRFTGVCKKAARRLHEDGWVVDLTFHDYTTLFIGNKPLKTSGMPQWSDNLQAIWERICDNTGWQDPDNGKILSSVEALKPNLVITRDDIKTRTLGEIVPERFHAISKPQPKDRASSWDVWQWCVGALGLISYIDKDKCIVTDTTEHYKSINAARAIFGENLHTFEESVDTDITSKGILLKSMDQSTGRVIEAFYPPPGDERLKTKRSAVGAKSEGGATVTANEDSGDYEEYNRYDIHTQAALDRAAEEAYEERSRQEMEGSFHTAEMVLNTNDGGTADIFDLRAGDALAVELSPGTRDTLNMIWSHEERVRYLVDNLGYDEDLADLIARNINAGDLQSAIFHIKSIELDLGPEKFDVEIKFHNLILINT
jgi:hypothetical protein